MALSGKYGRVHIPNIGEDEPVFILRAQDKLAEATIRMYKALAESHGSPVVKDLEEMINTFLHWTGTKKSPIKCALRKLNAGRGYSGCDVRQTRYG